VNKVKGNKILERLGFVVILFALSGLAGWVVFFTGRCPVLFSGGPFRAFYMLNFVYISQGSYTY